MSEELLKKIDLKDEHKDHEIEYDPESGFFRTQDGAHLLFRAEPPGESPSISSSGRLPADLNSSYGHGLYIGNTPESVAPYTWSRADNVINAYLTPPLSENDIHAEPTRSNIEALKDGYVLLRQRRALGFQAVAEAYNERYGATRLAAFDASIDIRTGQSIFSKTNHLVRPRWGIWRETSDSLTRIGSAEADSHPYKWALKLAGRRNRK